jgi:hypothetical protein
MQQRLHILDGRGKRERRHGRSIGIKRENITSSGGAVAKHKNFAPTFGTHIYEFIPCATEEAGEIEVASSKPVA